MPEDSFHTDNSLNKSEQSINKNSTNVEPADISIDSNNSVNKSKKAENIEELVCSDSSLNSDLQPIEQEPAANIPISTQNLFEKTQHIEDKQESDQEERRISFNSIESDKEDSPGKKICIDDTMASSSSSSPISIKSTSDHDDIIDLSQKSDSLQQNRKSLFNEYNDEDNLEELDDPLEQNIDLVDETVDLDSHHSNISNHFESNACEKSSDNSNESIKSDHAVNECDIAHTLDSNSNDVIFEETLIANKSTSFNVKKRKSIDIIEINDNDDIVDTSYTSNDKNAKKFKTSLIEPIIESLSSDSVREDPKEDEISEKKENEDEDDDALVDLRLSFANYQSEPVVITSDSSDKKDEVEEQEAANLNQDELLILDDKVESLIEEPKEKTDPVEILDLSQQTDRDANDAALGKFFFWKIFLEIIKNKHFKISKKNIFKVFKINRKIIIKVIFYQKNKK